MIIIIGKEDKLLVQDAQAYIQQCGSYIKRKKAIGWESISEDCYKIARRLRKAIGLKY